MSRKKRTKFQHAYDLVRAAIDNGDFEGSAHIPSLPSLARKAGVSLFTMWKAVDALRSEGRLVRAPWRRAALPVAGAGDENSGDTAGHELQERRTRTYSLQQEIWRDILNGRFRHDIPLPPEKELTARYGVSRMTLRKALLALSGLSILDRSGPRFSPASLAAPATAPARRIVLLGHGGNMGMNITWGYWHQEYLKLLELECSKARIAVDVVCFTREDTDVVLINGRTEMPFDLSDRDDVLGYVYEATDAESLDEALLQTVSRLGRPVAVLDEMGSWPPPPFLRRNPNVRVFRNTVTADPAVQVARFVLELGHRAAVFISPQHGLEFSQRRFDGLARAFSADPGARITAVTSHRDAHEVQTRALAEVNLPELMAFYDRWKRPLSPSYAVHLDNHMELIKSIVFGGAVRKDLDVLFRRALAKKEVTVWIAVNDFCAYLACDFLREHRVAIPGDIAVISFDDTPEALIKGITSYNFGNAATMMAMLRFIINPRLFPVRKPVIGIQGHIVSRRTTRLRSTEK